MPWGLKGFFHRLLTVMLCHYWSVYLFAGWTERSPAWLKPKKYQVVWREKERVCLSVCNTFKSCETATNVEMLILPTRWHALFMSLFNIRANPDVIRSWRISSWTVFTWKCCSSKNCRRNSFQRWRRLEKRRRDPAFNATLADRFSTFKWK